MGMIREWRFTFEGKPLWAGAIIISIVGIASAFIALRLARRGTPSNGVTTLPAWFIQSFGVLYFVGLGFVAYDKKDWLFALRGGSIGLAMILVSWNIARRKKKEPNKALEPTPTSVTDRADARFAPDSGVAHL